MAEYIEREAAISSLDELEKTSYHNSVLWPDHVEECREALRSIPAADVRPVVLCWDCKHWEKYDNTAGCGYCNKVKFEYGQIGYVFKPIREPDFFCAAGEKREKS